VPTETRWELRVLEGTCATCVGGPGLGRLVASDRRTTPRGRATTIPNARYLELPGQRHDVDAKVLAPVLADFFCRNACPQQVTWKIA
jgi:hypothetical protein